MADNADMRDVKVIILAGQKDFGRCLVASHLPLSHWPVLGVPVLQRLLGRLSSEGVKKAVICSDAPAQLLKRFSGLDGMEIEFVNEELPLGTAGCLRDAAVGCSQQLFIVLSASIVSLPPVDFLIKAHREGGGVLSVMFNPPLSEARPAGIYVCDRTVLEHIPPGGYCDIKEWLVPELVKAQRIVKAVELAQDAGNFRDGKGYLKVVTDYLEKEHSLIAELPEMQCKGKHRLWLHDSAEVDPSVMFFGPVVVMEGARLAQGAVVFGPSVVGKNCRLGKDSVLIRSVLWDKAEVGANCEVRNCLLDYNVIVASNTLVSDRVVPFEKRSILVRAGGQALRTVRNNICGLSDYLHQDVLKVTDTPRVKDIPVTGWLAVFLICAAFLWSFWPIIVGLWGIWQRSDEYSSGLLVPFLAGYIFWTRREDLKTIPVRPSLWGLVVLLFAEAMRLFGLYFMYGSAERFSIVVGIAAVVLLLLGWQFFKKTVFILLFMCLMLPWPNRVQEIVTLPLQQWATSSAVFCLETVGYDVIREGNIIHIGQANVAVAEACNGLRMVTAFFVISGMVVLLVKRKLWEKSIVLVSSLPIALFCNTIRLAITAVAFTFIQGEYWERIFHDFGGYAMMPLALGAIVVEFWLFKRLTVFPRERELVIIRR